MRSRTLASLLIVRQLILLAAVLVVIGVSQWLILRNVLYQTVAHTLNASSVVLQSFARHILVPHNHDHSTNSSGALIHGHAGRLSHRVLARLKAPATEIVVANTKGHVVLRSPGVPHLPALTPSSSFYLWNRRVVVTETISHGKHVAGYLWIMASTSSMSQILVKDSEIFGAVSVLVILGFAAVAVWSLRNALAPLRPVVDNTLRIAAGDYGRTVPIPEQPEELSELSHAVNTMSVRIQEAFAKERALSDQMRRFVADASHELRTPLTAINGFLGLLDTGKLTPEETLRGLTAMRRESQRMARLVSQLLTLSRLDGRAPHHPLQITPIGVNQWLDQLAPTLSALSPDHPLLIASHPQSVRVLADPDRLTEILFNIVDNAVRHTPSGTAIDIDFGQDHTADQSWIAVRDHGDGFPPDALDRVFHRFYRADQSRTGEGSGLGLSIVHALMEAQHGAVAAHNGPEGDPGALIILYFPAPPA